MAQLNVAPQVGPGVQGRLNLMPEDRLPQSVVGDIFSKVKDQSQVLPLGQQVPVGINETIVTTGDTFPEAGQVGNGTRLEDREGAVKPIAGLQYGGQRAFRPIKLAVIVTVSEEYARQNIDGLYSQLSTKLPEAIARAADLAVVRGQDALRGSSLIGIEDNGFIEKTTKNVDLNLAADASPDLIDQLLAGYRLITDNEDDGFDFTNFLAMPSMRPEIVTKRDANGNPVFVPGAYPGSGSEINVNAQVGSILGVPTSFAKSIGGKVGQAPGNNVKMVGGDFSQFCYGYADQIRFKVSDSASLDDGNGGVISLWQTNQIAVLCEATFGWLVPDPDAFVTYKTPVTP